MNIQVFDKVKWHYPDGKGCPDLQTAVAHFAAVVQWLRRNQLLSSFGKKIAKQKIGADFSLTSEMLTDKGVELLGKYYDEWLKSIQYGGTVETDYWDDRLQETAKSGRKRLFFKLGFIGALADNGITGSDFEQAVLGMMKKAQEYSMPDSDLSDDMLVLPSETGEFSGVYGPHLPSLAGLTPEEIAAALGDYGPEIMFGAELPAEPPAEPPAVGSPGEFLPVPLSRFSPALVQHLMMRAQGGSPTIVQPGGPPMIPPGGFFMSPPGRFQPRPSATSIPLATVMALSPSSRALRLIGATTLATHAARRLAGATARGLKLGVVDIPWWLGARAAKLPEELGVLPTVSEQISEMQARDLALAYVEAAHKLRAEAVKIRQKALKRKARKHERGENVRERLRRAGERLYERSLEGS